MTKDLLGINGCMADIQLGERKKPDEESLTGKPDEASLTREG
jgi:hypothetical protein